MRFLRRALVVFLFLVPSLFAAYWTCMPAGAAYLATQTLVVPQLQDQELDDRTLMLDLRRQIQKHFLSYAVYVPLEDIVSVTPGDPASGDLALLMQKACGKGRLYVWTPLKFRFPLTGEKVIEWCWKPRIKAT